jgi:hypothetical protein
MGLVCELAAKFVECVPKPIPKSWAEAMSTVADMAEETAAADADPKKKITLANEVLSENKLATVEPILVLSTAHVTEATAKQLTEDTIALVSVRPFGDDGWLVYVPTDPAIWAELDTEAEKGEMPQELLTMLKFARELKCVWVLLDSAALEVSDLPSFDW